jgi:GTPase SAR1 family protein
MRIVYYIGQPGTGKTTLMRGILAEYSKVEEPEFVKEGLVTYHKFNNQKVIILGRYDDGTFAGTDTWSKGVGPKFREWLLGATEEFPDWTIYGEGERLSNGPNLDAMFQENIGMNLICLQVSEEELERRRAARNNTQNESWMKGMRTRIENLCNKYPHKVEVIG